MYIRKRYFWIITILFLLLPLSSSWKLLLFGESATGEVIEQLTVQSENVHNIHNGSTYCLIQFMANGNTYTFTAPENVKYEVGRKVKVYYNRNKPDKHIMFNFAGLILSPRMYLPASLLLIWIAFYLTMNQQYQLKSKTNKSTQLKKF